MDGSRVQKLRALFESIAQDRSLAILTQNKSGVVAVLNLLQLANLLEYFSAIWCMSAPQGVANPLRFVLFSRRLRRRLL